MTDVSDHFLLLTTEADRLAGRQLLTRPVGLHVGDRDVLVGLDVSGQKHLLVPLGSGQVEPDESSQGVTLGPRVLRVGPDEDVTYADLHCRMSTLDVVFERLVDDVLGRLAEDSTAPVTTCRIVLDQWRALLKAAGQPLSREATVGLVGELEVLQLLAQHDPPAALDAWCGPSGAVHDFVREGAELEVKTTTSVDGNFVSITNIDQLDPGLVGSLHLLVVHLREDVTAPGLDDRIDALIQLGVPRDGLLVKAASAGHIYGSSSAVPSRFRVRSVRAWPVGTTFPGLRRTDIGEQRLKGVSRIRYELALDAAPRRVPDKDLDGLLAGWMGTA